MRSLSTKILILFVCSVLLPSCEKNDPASQEPPKIILRKKSAELIQADRAFAFELFKEVYSRSEADNLMISPLSVSCALGMTFNGSAGSTDSAFRNVLHFNGLSRQEVNESYMDLMDQLVHLDNRVIFNIANSIWYKEGYPVLEEFIQTNRAYFDAMVSELNFADPGSVDIINSWIEEKTNGRIRDMLDLIPPNAIMYLVNAIYFDARWKYAFDKEQTAPGTFYLAGGGTQQADFMKVNGGFSFAHHNDFTAVELPYGDSTFSMVVMLPDAGKTVSELVDQMDADTWSSWFDDSRFTDVQVEMPKFTYGFKDSLNEPLIQLGLGVAFDPFEADFSGICPGRDLYISRVIHQSFIDVKEEGTEAAAATIVEIREFTSSIPGPVVFRLDRPFLYLIKENSTGAILFMGSVGKPEYSG